MLATGNVRFQSGSSLNVEIGGAAPGNTAGDHDQLVVTGAVTIAENATLNFLLVGGFTPEIGQTFTLVNNDGTTPTDHTGSFAGLPEGAVIENFLGSDLNAVVSYHGGDGNDITLKVVSPNTPPVAHAGGYYTIFEGEPLPLNGSGSSDADDDSLSYSWDLNNDGIFGDATGATPTVEWAALQALIPPINDNGSYPTTLRVSDGHTHTDSFSKLSILNAPPSVTISTDTDIIVPGETVLFVLRRPGCLRRRPGW